MQSSTNIYFMKYVSLIAGSACKYKASEYLQIAIDNYQALHLPTEYGEWLSPVKRRVLQVEEVRVAHSMRFLEQPDLLDGVVLCAAHRSSSFSPRTRVRQLLSTHPYWKLLTNLKCFYVLELLSEVQFVLGLRKFSAEIRLTQLLKLFQTCLLALLVPYWIDLTG